MQLKNFCKAQDTIIQRKQQPTEGEKIFTNSMSKRGLIFKIHKELKNLDIKRPNNTILKWDTDLNREFFTKEIQMAEKHLKKCSMSLAMR